MPNPTAPNPTAPYPLTFRRLRVEPSPQGYEPSVPGVLVINHGGQVWVAHCRDSVAAVSALWHARPYQCARAVIKAAPGDGDRITVTVGWSAGSRTLVSMNQPVWRRQLAALSGQVADVLTASGEKSLARVLAPMLSQTPPPWDSPTRRPSTAD